MAALFSIKRGIFKYPLCRFIKRCLSSENVSGNTPVLAEKLENRSVIELRGDESIDFLQGLITNDIHHLTNSMKSSVQLPGIFAMMLNTQGRVLYDVFIYRHKTSPSNLLIECDSRISDDVVKHLKIYRVRKKIDINLSINMEVWSVFNENSEVVVDTPNELNEGIIIKDPRASSLGSRVLANSDSNVLQILGITAVKETYRRKLYEHGVGEGIADHPPGNCFPLECNGDYLNGVSFHKGCYIGQELTSRVHHTGVVRKRIMPITIESDSPDSLQLVNESKNAEIINENGKNVGKLRGLVGKVGIALMRIDPALAAKELILKSGSCSAKLTVKRPDWWPLEVTKNKIE